MAKKPKKRVRTIDIEVALMNHLEHNRNYVVPNVTDMSGLVRFETDILMVTKAGYATGVEIKINAADLRNDLKKRKARMISAHGAKMFEHFYSPYKYFYYAVPEEIVEETRKQIDERFGIMAFKNYRIHVVRDAQCLFTNKWSDGDIQSLLRIGTMRILTLKKRIAYPNK